MVGPIICIKLGIQMKRTTNKSKTVELNNFKKHKFLDHIF